MNHRVLIKVSNVNRGGLGRKGESKETKRLVLDNEVPLRHMEASKLARESENHMTQLLQR